MKLHHQLRLMHAVAAFVALSAVSAIVAQDQARQAPRDVRLDQLIGQLNSDNREARAQTANEIIRVGPTMIEKLKAAAKATTPEHSQRLVRVAQRIEWLRDTQHLRYLVLGLINYDDVYRFLPAAYSVGKNGKPLLSWRVAILPFLDENALYDEFHHDEPWDSEHNKLLIAKMPNVFHSPNSQVKPGMTVYLGVGGKHGIIAAPDGIGNLTRPYNGIPMSRISDDRSTTLMFVEASDARAVVWTKPEEWVPNENTPSQDLVSSGSDGFIDVYVDGLFSAFRKPRMMRP